MRGSHLRRDGLGRRSVGPFRLRRRLGVEAPRARRPDAERLQSPERLGLRGGALHREQGDLPPDDERRRASRQDRGDGRRVAGQRRCHERSVGQGGSRPEPDPTDSAQRASEEAFVRAVEAGRARHVDQDFAGTDHDSRAEVDEAPGSHLTQRFSLAGEVARLGREAGTARVRLVDRGPQLDSSPRRAREQAATTSPSTEALEKDERLPRERGSFTREEVDPQRRKAERQGARADRHRGTAQQGAATRAARSAAEGKRPERTPVDPVAFCPAKQLGEGRVGGRRGGTPGGAEPPPGTTQSSLFQSRLLGDARTDRLRRELAGVQRLT